MYKLSEQPASRIISEMPDFSFLNDTYVFTVKEQFNISDTFFEVGDLVAISGANKTAICILPYETLKKCRSDCFMSCVDREGSVLEISLEDFKKRFELSEAETEKVESITNDIKPIRSQKSAEMHELGYDEPDVDLIILYIIAFMIVSFFMWLSVKLHCEVGVAFTVAFHLFTLGYIISIIIGKIKYNALKTKYQKLYAEIDEKRAKNGMCLKEL